MERLDIWFQPNSAMAVSLKMAQIDRHIKDMQKNHGITLTGEERLWLTVLMLITPWSEQLMGIIHEEEMPDGAAKPRFWEEVAVKGVKFADIGHEMSSSVVTLVPHNYLIIALPNGRYEIRDGEMGANHALIKDNIPTFSEAVKEVCARHNKLVKQVRKDETLAADAAKKLAKDLEQWKTDAKRHT